MEQDPSTCLVAVGRAVNRREARLCVRRCRYRDRTRRTEYGHEMWFESEQPAGGVAKAIQRQACELHKASAAGEVAHTREAVHPRHLSYRRCDATIAHGLRDDVST